MEKNRTPVLRRAGQSLKTTGKSNYYIYGEGFDEEDIVRIRHRTTGDLLWEGPVKKVKDGIGRAQLDYVGRKGLNLGDLELVDVTVTNSLGAPSNTLEDQVIADFPP